MLRRWFLYLIPLLAVCVSPATGQADHVLPAVVRIGLATGQASLTLVLPPGTTAGTSQGTIWRVKTETTLVCTMGSDGSITAGTFSYGSGPVRFDSPNAFLAWGTRRYRGSLVVKRGAKGLSLINEAGVDDYLRGVLPPEIGTTWPAAAQMAMAVTARTYALSHLGVHARDGYDLCALNHCQVYEGANAEAATTDAAIAATSGRIITYMGKPIQAYYHSASGGYTENVDVVWGSAPEDYLRGVPDPNEKSDYKQWQVILAWSDLQVIMAKKYPRLGRLTAITIIERGPSGRIKTIELAGSLTKTRLGGDTFRFLFPVALRSSLLDLAIEYGLTPNLNPQDLAGNPVLLTVAPTAEAPWFGIFDAEWNLVPVRLIIDGRGWGHGVGMSQWGAKSLADMGYTWDMIVKYYYQGIEIEDWRPLQAQPAVPAPGDATG